MLALKGCQPLFHQPRAPRRHRRPDFSSKAGVARAADGNYEFAVEPGCAVMVRKLLQRYLRENFHLDLPARHLARFVLIVDFDQVRSTRTTAVLIAPEAILRSDYRRSLLR